MKNAGVRAFRRTSVYFIEVSMAKVLLRYKQLNERNIAKSWEQLRNLIENEGFSPGRLLSPNCRVWFEDEGRRLA
jgi:hypothetical protein